MLKRQKPDTQSSVLYKDDDIIISEAYGNKRTDRPSALLFKSVLDQLIKHRSWIREGDHRWNLWTIASYVGIFDLSNQWPLFETVSICYESKARESVHSIINGNRDWMAYKIYSDVYNIDYVILIGVVYK
jgi:hypothetical protein